MAIDKDLEKSAQELIEEIRNTRAVYYDLETTSATGKTVTPITFSAFQPSSGKTLGGKGNEILIDSGSDEANLSAAENAMNIFDGDNLIDSSKQLRKLLLNRADEDLAKLENIKIHLQKDADARRSVLETYSKKKKTIRQLLTEITKTFGENGSDFTMVGYNNQTYDDDLIMQMANNYAKNHNNKVGKGVANSASRLFGKGQTKDARNAVIKSFEEQGLENVARTGHTKLQEMALLATGHGASAAHSADDDVLTTKTVVDELSRDNNIYVKMAKAVSLAMKKKGLTDFDTRGVGVNSTEYKQLFDAIYQEMAAAVQQNASSGKEVTDVDINAIVSNYMTKSGSNYGYKSETTSSAQKPKKQAEQQAKNQRQRQKQNTQKKVSEAKQFVQQLLSSQTVTGDKKIEAALTGKHFDTRAQMVGLDFTNVTRISVADYLEEIYDQAAKWGIGVIATVENGKLKVGFYPNDQEFSGDWDSIANIELGLVDEKGQIRSGKGTSANLLYPTLKWGTDKKGKRFATPALTSAMEMQLKNIANLFGYGRDEDDPSKLTQNILAGNIGEASGTLRFASRNALQGNRTVAQNKSMEEAIGQLFGNKNPEQLASSLGMYSTADLAQSFYYSYQNFVNSVYARNFDERKEKGLAWGSTAPEVNPYELTPEEVTRFNLAYDMITQLDDDTLQWQAQSMKDEILKTILTDSQFKFLRNEIRTFKNMGLVSNFEGIKEESVINGLGSVGGAKDILPLAIFGDYSNRALSQSFNYQQRAPQSLGGAKSIFTSEQGKLLGVNYNSRERSQYNGAFTDDSEIQTAINELIKELTGKGEMGLVDQLEKLAVSVREGGVVMSKSMAETLTSYKEKLSSGDIPLNRRGGINGAFLKRFGISKTDLENLEIGDTLGIAPHLQEIQDEEKGWKRGGRTALKNELVLNSGDLVLGLRKTAQGVQLVTKKLDEVENGSKLLTEGGGRYTARVVEDPLFSMITDKIQGAKRANYLMEKESSESRKYMPQLAGRFSYIVQSALKGNGEKGSAKSMEEIYKAMGKIAPTWKKMFKLVEDGNGDKKFQSNLQLMDSGKIGYFDNSGKLSPLFTSREQERKAIIEEDGSELEALGKALLGEDSYNKTRWVAAQAINMAKDASYFESTGSGNARVREGGRVKFADKERQAFARAVRGYQNAIPEENLEGLAAYNRIETALQNSYGKKGLQAQKTVKNLEKFYDSENKGVTPTGPKAIKGPVVTLKWGHANANKGEIDVSSIATSFNWENGVVNQADYANSAMFLARDFILKNPAYKNAAIALDLRDLREERVDFATKNNYVQLTDINPLETENGDFIPSLTDKIVTNIIRAAQDAAKSGAAEGLDDAFDTARQELKTQATDKDSELFKQATESYMPNASYVKAIGTPDTKKVIGGTVNNTAFITSNRLKELLTTTRQGSKKSAYKKDLIKNVQSLGWMYRAGTRNDHLGKLDLTGAISDSRMTIQHLKELEEALIDNIIKATKAGEMDITGQLHRYPSTSGLDIHHTKIAIDDDNVSDNAVMVGRGQSIATNADYDGDKVWLRASMANTSGYTNYEEYEAATKAAKQLRLVEDKVADDLAIWDKQNNVKKDKTEQLLTDYENRNPNKLAALMSKYNKKYVGQFSNMGTRVREAMSKTGFDELSRSSGADAKFIRAFFEVFEQDSISAKKVFARLSAAHGGGDEGDKVAIDELTSLFNKLLSGDIDAGITQAQQMNILGELLDSRQFQNARFSLRESDYEAYKQLGLDQYEAVDENGNLTSVEGIPFEVLSAALSRFNSHLQGKGFAEGIKAAIQYNWQLRDAKVPEANVTGKKVKVTRANTNRANVNRAKNNRGKGNTKESAEQQKGYEKAEEKAKEDAKKVVDSFATIASDHIVVDNSNGQHSAIFVEDKEAGTIGLRNNGITSVTTFLKALFPDRLDESKLSFREKQKLHNSSVKRTFMHGLMEIIGNLAKDGRDISNITESDLIGTEDYTKLEEALVSELGLGATEESIAKLRARAIATAKIGQKTGLIGLNTQQEVNLGGYFANQYGGVEGQGVKGTADVISYTGDKAIIGDWKFSQDASQETYMERLLQANIYLGIEEKKVKDAIKKLEAKKKENNGVLSEEDIKELAELTQKESALANGEVQIARNHIRDGQTVTEVSKATRLSSEEIFSLLQSLMSGDIKTSVDIANQAYANSYDRKYYDEEGNETYSQENYDQAKTSINKKVSDLKEQGTAYKELIKMETELGTLKARNNSKDKEDIDYLENIVKREKETLNLNSSEVVTKQTLLEALQKKHQAIVDEINALEGLTDEQKQAFISYADSEYAKQRRSIGTVYKAYEKSNTTNPNQEINKYLKSIEQIGTLEREKARLQTKGQNLSGMQAIENRNLISSYDKQISGIQNQYKLRQNADGTTTLNGIVLSEEEVNRLEQERSAILDRNNAKLLQTQETVQKSKGFLEKINENFKNSFQQISGFFMNIMSFQSIERIFSNVVQKTSELDSKMVDLQIASGYTRTEINSMMQDFNKLGNQLGKTTTEIAEAANDWLRAGYEGSEASQLTEASMNLATLGMINSSDATSYLISVMKGWKLEANEIDDVVDKLTATDMAAA